MSIDKLPSGKHRVRWRTAAGKPKSKAFDRRKDAQNFEREIILGKQTGKIEASNLTLAELAAEHMAAVKAELAATTYQTYRDLWAAHVDGRILGNENRTWAHEIADTSLKAITPAVIETWRNERLADAVKRLKRAGAGQQAIRKTMALMQTMFDRAVRDEKTTSNPVKLVNKPSGKTQARAEVVAPGDVEKIRAHLGPTGQMMVALIAQTGMRPGEARALQWKDIGKQSIRVDHGCAPDGTPKPTKTEHRRTVPLIKTLAADLKAWRKAQGNPSDARYVFPRTTSRRTTGGGPCWSENDWRNFARRDFKSAAAKAKVEIGRPYDLRHSISSLWLAEGINPIQVAAWLGNDAAVTLATYAHVIAEIDPADKTTAADRIAKARIP